MRDIIIIIYKLYSALPQKKKTLVGSIFILSQT